MKDHDRIFSRIINAAGQIRWFVKTSEGLLGPFASWQESRSSLAEHLSELPPPMENGKRDLPLGRAIGSKDLPQTMPRIASPATGKRRLGC